MKQKSEMSKYHRSIPEQLKEKIIPCHHSTVGAVFGEASQMWLLKLLTLKNQPERISTATIDHTPEALKSIVTWKPCQCCWGKRGAVLPSWGRDHQTLLQHQLSGPAVEVVQILSEEIPAIVLPLVSILLLLTRLNERIWTHSDFPWGPIRKLETISPKPSETTVSRCDKEANPPFCHQAHMGKEQPKTTKILTCQELRFDHHSSISSAYSALSQHFLLLRNTQAPFGFGFLFLFF